MLEAWTGVVGDAVLDFQQLQNALIHDAFMASYVYEVIKDVEWCLVNKNSIIEAPFIDLRRSGTVRAWAVLTLHGVALQPFLFANVIASDENCISDIYWKPGCLIMKASSAFFLNLSSLANASMIWFFKDSRLFRSLSAASFTCVGANVGASS
ncbi:hypothetical protein L1987_20239 [Smallanthus sonchifolius]|uniref:Uncharacterized protein n=1 Tax=Smallanthus sonchifolius TaxID=185202 RepID=A0ACB9ISZ2_9ASTR|nr:hypothetical protein L1987_20239 [Smallanthus sonchifolius]